MLGHVFFISSVKSAGIENGFGRPCRMIFPRQFSQQSTEMAKRRLIFSLIWICHRSCLLFSFCLLLFPPKPEFSTAGASGLLDVPLTFWLWHVSRRACAIAVVGKRFYFLFL